jgi:hypothetical protein
MFSVPLRYVAAPSSVDVGPFLRSSWPTSMIRQRYTGIGRINITYGPPSGSWLGLRLVPFFELENGSVITSLSTLGINASNYMSMGLEMVVTAMAMIPTMDEMQACPANFTHRSRLLPTDTWSYSASALQVNESACVQGTNYTWNSLATNSIVVSKNASGIAFLNQNQTVNGNRFVDLSTYDLEGQITWRIYDQQYNTSGDPFGIGISRLVRTINYTGYIPDYHPLARFLCNVTRVEPGAWVQFVFTGRGGNSPSMITWNFGDGTSTTGPSASHKYVAAGNYTVILTINDGNGDVSTITQVIQVIVPAPDDTGPTVMVVVLLVLAIGAAILAVTAYDRKRGRVTSRRKEPGFSESKRAAGRGTEPARVEKMDGGKQPYAVFARDVLKNVDRLGFDDVDIQDLLSLLAGLDEKERGEYIDRLLAEKPGFDAEF